jgi:hypothetical protein
MGRPSKRVMRACRVLRECAAPCERCRAAPAGMGRAFCRESPLRCACRDHEPRFSHRAGSAEKCTTIRLSSPPARPTYPPDRALRGASRRGSMALAAGRSAAVCMGSWDAHGAPGAPRPAIQPALRHRSLQARGPPGGRRRLTVAAAAFDVSVRPYTLRKGDTLQSIAKKRGARRARARSRSGAARRGARRRARATSAWGPPARRAPRGPALPPPRPRRLHGAADHQHQPRRQPGQGARPGGGGGPGGGAGGAAAAGARRAAWPPTGLCAAAGHAPAVAAAGSLPANSARAPPPPPPMPAPLRCGRGRPSCCRRAACPAATRRSWRASDRCTGESLS